MSGFSSLEEFTDALERTVENADEFLDDDELMEASSKIRSLGDKLEQSVSDAYEPVEYEDPSPVSECSIDYHEPDAKLDVGGEEYDIESISFSWVHDWKEVEIDAVKSEPVQVFAHSLAIDGWGDDDDDSEVKSEENSEEKSEWQCPHCETWNKKWITPNTCPNCLESVTGEYEVR